MTDSRQLIRRILEFVHRHSVAVIAATLLITALFGVSLLRLRVDPDVESLLSEVDKLTGGRGGPSSAEVEQNFFVLAAEAADPFTLDGLAALWRALQALERLPQFQPGVTPFNLVGFTRSGTRLALQSLSPGGRAPQSAEELRRFRDNLSQSPTARNLVISADGTTLIAFFPVQRAENYTRLMQEIDEIIAPLKAHYRTHVTGSIPFMRTTESYLSRDLSRLLALAVVVILFTFYLGFRSLRAVLLPLSVVLVGTLWCLGFMALVGYPLSIMSVVIPPLVLALGSSYSIHVLNQYYREAGGGGRRGDAAGAGGLWVIAAVAHVNRTILLAAVTTVAGLLSLLAVSMKQSREFALATSVGVAACALLSLFFFPAVLYRLGPPRERQSLRVRTGWLARSVGRLGELALRGRYPIVAAVLVLGALFALSAGRIRYNTDVMTYLPEHESVVRDMRFFTAKVGGFEEVNITLTAPEGRRGYFLELENLSAVSRFEERLREIPDVCYISSFTLYLKYLNQAMHGSYALPDSRAPVLLLSRYLRALSAEDSPSAGLRDLASEDFSALTIKLRVYDSLRASFIDEVGLRRLLGRIDGLQAAELPAEIGVSRWGPILRYLSLSDILQRDTLRSMLVAVAAIACITGLAFRSLRFALLALVPLLSGIVFTGLFLVLTDIPLDMITIMVSSIAIGVGVDDSIHFLIQYRRQAARRGGDRQAALRATMMSAGRPIVLTSVSIVAGLLVLTLGIFKPIVYFGLLMVLTLTAATLGTVLVLPALMAVLPGRAAVGKGGR